MKRVLLATLAFASLLSLKPSSAITQELPFFYNREEVRQGDIVQVSTRLAFRSKDGTLTFRGTKYHGFVTGGIFNVLLGVDMDTEPGDYLLNYEFDNGETRTLTLPVLGREFGKESLKVAPKYTDLDEETQVRVAKEKKMLDALWATSTKDRLWKSSFLRPTVGALGSPFGLRRFFNEQPRSPHSGLDIKAPAGSQIYASNYGKVVVAADLFFTGNTIVIDHGQSLYTIYAHLSKMNVKEGDNIERAQEIGLVGATGRVTGPHLHWAAKVGGARVDPATLPGAVL
jgi:murein DD-endopeptidase MepM/ murein hydrolase activator NlpD